MKLEIARSGFAPVVSRTRAVAVKICGIMRPEDALYAASTGADMIGFVFAESRRQLSPFAARSIISELRDSGSLATTVGVFVNESPERIREIVEYTGIDVVQLSGDEPPSCVLACASFAPVIKALRFAPEVRVDEALKTVDSYISLGLGNRLRLLVDAYHPGFYGGTGSRADWALAVQLAGRCDLILAGGLTPSGVGAAIRDVAPWGVDVSSGVEREGHKDQGLIDDFIKAAHEARGAASAS
jgi:phosphoribosylanthranilate isomerase